jgi:hypothetical protein
VLTRRREIYHRVEHPGAGDHDPEHGLSVSDHPPLDHHIRSLLDERVLGHDLPLEDYARAAFVPIVAWGAMTMDLVEVAGDDDSVTVRLRLHDADRLHAKEITVDARGDVTVHYRWDPNAFTTGAWFAPELSLARDVELHCVPVADEWRYPITTVAKSERGLEETVQGLSITPRWPVHTGEAVLRLLTGADG